MLTELASLNLWKAFRLDDVGKQPGRQMAALSPPAEETSTVLWELGRSDLMEVCRSGCGGANPGLSLLPLAFLQKHTVCVPGLSFGS